MDPWPGRHWTAIDIPPSQGRGWWKRHALVAWLEHRPEISAVVWCDDDLRSTTRQAALRRSFAQRSIQTLLVAPPTEVGLIREDVALIESWLGAHPAA